MTRRYTRKRRGKKGRGKTKKQKEIDEVWGAFKKGRSEARHRQYMKDHPLPKMSIDKAFKQPDLKKTEYNFEPLTDEKIKELERDLMNKSGTYVEGKTVLKYPKRAGKRKRKKRKTRRKRRRKRRRKSKRRR